MRAILIKEINSFFTSPIAYLVIGFFLLINGLFLWFFDDDFNILNAGFADENNNRTIELLKTKPISDWQIVLGKFWASLLLAVIAITPTITYVYTIYKLRNLAGNIDFGSTIGSYLGILFLASTYTSVGLFTSTLSKNQIVAFILGVFITFLLFYGFEAVSNSFGNDFLLIQKLGINEHFKSISRGVIDTRDLVYFVSVTGFFLFITKIRLEND